MYPAYRPTALSITGPIPSPLCFSFPTAATTAATPLCTTRRWRDCSDPWPCSWPHLPPYPSQPNPGFHTTWSFVCAPPPHPPPTPLPPPCSTPLKCIGAILLRTRNTKSTVHCLFTQVTFFWHHLSFSAFQFFQGSSLTLSANTFHSWEVCTNGSGVCVY